MRLREATVLVVDDEPDLREIFSAWLEVEGCRVFDAANGAEALEVLEAEKIDALVSDIHMPIMDGVALARTVYESKLVIPSIILASGSSDVMPREMHGFGVETLMRKPLKRQDLIRVLENSLMESDQNWLTPSAEPMAQTVAMEIASLEESMRSCQFQLGRGGCCFFSNRLLTEQKTTHLSIRFQKESLCLEAQGTVRWFDYDTAQTGMSFDYLDPECRDWVIDAMRTRSSRSFIPQCSSCSSNRATAFEPYYAVESLSIQV
jgi:CheY-like chemotaxis protein